jgi:hypothetical protein
MKLTHRTVLAFTALTSGVAWAHPGHGETNAVHWHAFDAWGWALALAVAAAAVWWARRK